LLFTQGLPQQSALVAQVVPAATPPSAVQSRTLTMQRGMPSASYLQQFAGFAWQKLGLGAPMGSQQRLSTPHAPSLQMAPGGSHWFAFVQRPRVSPLVMLQVVGFVPGG
jgi:hypothetical protein